MEHAPTRSPAAMLPLELAGHTLESLHAMHGPERSWTYGLILAGVIGAFASLPFIHVDVSVRAPGLVRPVTERAELKTAVAGRIREVMAGENDRVAEGQVLVVIDSAGLDEQVRREHEQRMESVALMADLQALLSGREQDEVLRTTAMRHELRQFEAQLAAYELAGAKAGNELGRYTTLAEKGIATRQELDNARFEAERLQAEARLFREQARARWAARLREEQATHADLVSAIRRLEEERVRHVVRAPVGGVLVGFIGWSPGAQLVAGQSLGAVSPEDVLRVECRVSTRDIGLVRPGQLVRLQIDAYPYTQWGMLDGVVEAIGGDLLGGAAGEPGYFKVLIRPRATRLTLPNGVSGELKKGLTLTARYVVARRSLLQILYDDASAWLNPGDNRRTDSALNHS